MSTMPSSSLKGDLRDLALVVPTDPDRPPSLDAVRDHVRSTLGAAAAPRELRLVARISRTALGKPLRNQ